MRYSFPGATWNALDQRTADKSRRHKRGPKSPTATCSRRSRFTMTSRDRISPRLGYRASRANQVIRQEFSRSKKLKSDPKSLQIGLKLLGGLKHDAVHAQLPCGLGVGRNVIHVDGFLGFDFAGFQCFFIDDGIRFARAHAARVDARRKQPKEPEGLLQVSHMQWVGIGQQSQPISL